MRKQWMVSTVVGLGAAAIAYVSLHAWRWRRSVELAKLAAPAQSQPESPDARILVVGDSTAVGVGASDPPHSVAGLLASAYPRRAVENRAVAGATLAETLSQLPGRGRERFDVILIQAGGDEVLSRRSPDRIARDLQAVLSRAKASAATVVLMPAGNVGNSPMFAWPISAWLQARARAFHAVASQVAHEAGVVYVDLFRERGEDPFTREPERYFAKDGLHPSDAGYRLWFDELIRNLHGSSQHGAYARR